ncbi:MAG: translation initiation factor IF-2 [Lachnospiraceae bacterium]|nr:translation initiation factor IF-2 [Lachnospiraceae bacterium]
MKVHELAKELDIQSKDIIAFLNEKGIEVKAAQSSLDDEAVSLVKKKFAKRAEPAKETAKPEAKSEPAAEKKAEPAAKTSEPAEAKKKPAEAPAGEPVKKKKIIFVNNPHNSKLPGQGGPRPQGGRPDGARPDRRPAPGQGQNKGHMISGSDYTHQIIKPRQDVINRQLQEQRDKEAVAEEAARKAEEAARAAAEAKEAKEAPAKPQRPMNVIIEEAPKKEYVRSTRDNRTNRPDGNRGFAPRQNRDGAPADRGERKPFRREDGVARPAGREGFRRTPGQAPQGRGTGFGPGARPDKASFAAAPSAPKPGSDRRDDKFGKNKKNDSARDTEKKVNEKRRSQEKEGRNKNFLMQDDEETLAMKRRTGKFIKPEKKPEAEEEVIKVITLEDTVTIKDLADKMKIQPAAIVKKLFLQGKMVNPNQEISFEEAEEIAMEYEILCERAVKVDVIEELLKEEDESEKDMVGRPPVVCVMGHVDHGKTSLLDAIRKTNVIDKEAGGITQAIGAYTVNAKGRDITFLDTPGHEAFTAMRMRGANSTDIAVLVVAADDGVMPQTVEAINHAKAAGVEIIVAVNKIDKPGANPDKVKQELSEYELIPTDWGGTTEFVNISAKRGDGIDDLLETILLTADIMELKANPKRRARGIVIEAELDKGRGPVATVLVQKGTLKGGDFVSAGACHGKVRAMVNDKGKSVKTAGPSIPVEILGLDGVPNAGDVFIAHDSDKTAKQFAETFIAQNKEKKLEETKAAMSLDDLFSKIQEGNLKELNLIIKADVQGSVEAVKQSLTKLSNEEVVVKVIHGGVGAINESDVSLALASNAIIIGFNVKPDVQAKATAEHEGVDIRLYKVIYQAIEDVENAMKGMLDPVFEEKIIGHAEVRQIFKASAIGKIAGSYVLDGVFQKNCKIRIRRGDDVIYEGALASLKRFKDDVKEVKAGFECGLVFEDYDGMEELDVVEAYVMVEVPR